MTSQPDLLHVLGLSGKPARIIFLCMLCAGILLLLLTIQSTIELVQLRLLGHETHGHVIRQEVWEKQVMTNVGRNSFCTRPFS